MKLWGGGVAAGAGAQAGGGFFRRQTDGGKDVRWLDGARGTGGSGRTSKAFQVERDEEGFAFDAGKDEICGVRSARSSASILARLGDALQQTLLQFVAEVRHALSVFCERFASELCCFAEANDAGDVFCTRAEAPLVMSAIEKLAQTRSAAHVQGADSLWRVQFVPGNGEEIDRQRIDVNWDFSCGLHSIGVKVDVGGRSPLHFRA